MMLALLLAQLVLPWPGLDSPLVQPPGMICLGACAGPVIYGPAERGRLVVACDMTSDTCSDGRKITTTRSTPVPCEVSPGVWTEVGVNQGCYSVRGLESWAQNTSYLSWGAELDREPWLVHENNSLTALPGGGYRLCQLEGAASNSGLRQNIGDPGAVFTLAGIGQANTGTAVTIGAYSVFTNPPHALPERWGQFSLTGTPGAGRTVFAYPRPAGPGQCIDLRAFWLTQTSTPGRPCWGGEAPVTCGGEVSEISTAGWPTTHGSIEIKFRIDEAPQDFAIILDGRSSATVGFNIHYARATGRLNHRQGDRVMEGPTITLGTWYRVRLEREGRDVRMYVNGALGAAESDWPAWSYPYKSGMALLGRYTVAAQFYVNGSIRALTVRSYEEVSP